MNNKPKQHNAEPGSDDDELTLPRASLNKLIKELVITSLHYQSNHFLFRMVYVSRCPQ